MACYVIGYDIRNIKRLARVHRVMKDNAVMLQYSVYLYRGTKSGVDELLEKLKTKINEKEDDVRCYLISDDDAKMILGRELFADGMFWSGMPKFTRIDGGANIEEEAADEDDE